MLLSPTLAAGIVFAAPPESQASVLLKLRSGAVLERQRAYANVVEQYNQTVAGLVRVVREEHGDEIGGPRDLAIQLLGELRADAAVDILLENLTFEPKGPRLLGLEAPQTHFVAAVALSKIGGGRVISAVIARKIQQSSSRTERDLAAWVVMAVEGKDAAIDRLERASAPLLPDDPIKERLAEAIAFVRNYGKPTGPPNTTLLKPLRRQ